jgi:hypothetical protein
MIRPASDTRAGQKAAVVGGLLGLAPALGLGALRLINQDQPEAQTQVAGNLVFALVYASPYLLTLALSRTRDPATRGGLLLAVSLLSLVASFSSLAGVTVALLPATVVIFVASARSIRVADQRVSRILSGLLAGLVGAAAIGFSFFALFGLEAEESRCWALTRGVDGQQRWQARDSVGGPSTLTIGVAEPDVERVICTSDIITSSEATSGLVVLAAASVGMVGVSRLRRRAPAASS